MFYIYVVQNLKNDKVYIGQTVEYPNRCYKHFSMLRNNRHKNTYLQSAWNMYTEPYFTYFLLGEYQTQEEVDEAEQFYIAWYSELDMCYNLESGGSNFKTHAQESIEKIKEARATQVFTEEHKAKMSEAHKGLPWSEARRKAYEESEGMTQEHLQKLQEGKERYIEEHGHPKKGIPVSKEHKELLRNLRLGSHHTEEHKKMMSERLTGTSIGGKTYKAFGEEKTISQWSHDPRCLVNRTTLKQRMQAYGWADLEYAMVAPLGTIIDPKNRVGIPHNGTTYEYQGESKTIVQWALDPRCKVSRSTLNSRIRKGWNIEKSLITPTKNLSKSMV